MYLPGRLDVAWRISWCVPIALAFACAEGLPVSPGTAGIADATVDGAPGTGEPMEGGSPDRATAGREDGALVGDVTVDTGPGPCEDGQKNGLETDTDCGGPDCDPCPAGDSCIENTDCASGTCEPDASVCMAAAADAGGASTGNPCPMLTAPEAACTCQAYAGKGYFFCPGPKDWQTARTQCMGTMLDLVAIEDQAEQTFVAMNVSTNSWIGAANVGATSWIWTATGTEFWNMTAVGGAYANWAPSHPLAVAGLCAMLQQPMNNWATITCSLPSGYVCEQK